MCAISVYGSVCMLLVLVCVYTASACACVLLVCGSVCMLLMCM